MKKANGSGTIFKRDGKYVVRVTTEVFEGKQRQKQIGTFGTIKEAEERLQKYIESNSKSVDKQTLGFFCDIILKEKEQTVRKDTYKDMYQRPAKYLQPIWEEEVIDLNYNILQTLLNNIENYYNRVYVKALLTEIYKNAIKYNLKILNYPNLLSVGKKPAPKVKRQALTCEDVNKLWSKEGEVCVDMFLILLYTGMRINELLEIKLSDIQDNYIIGGSKTEAGRDRVIPINKQILPIIERYKLPDKIYLFENRPGKPYSYSYIYSRLNDEIKDISGKDINLHDTRHTFTSRMSELGVDLYVIKRIIGHKIKDITEGVYIHQSPDQLIEAVNKLYY